MKKIISLAACAVSIALTAGHVSAEQVSEGFYVGAAYSALTYSENGFEDADLGALFARGGYQVNEYVAAEVRLGDGVQDDTISYLGYDIKVKLKEYYGVYLKAGIPTGVGLYPYAVIGGTHLKLEASVAGYTASDTSSDVSYGVGVDYWFNPQISAGLEYMKLYDKDGTELSGVSLGLNYKF